MGLQTVKFQGFKSIEATEIELTRLNVLLGANGAGKSNFISLFRLLNQMSGRRFQIAVQEAGGAGDILHFGPKNTQVIDLELIFEPEDGAANGYQCRWLPTNDDSLQFERELVCYHDLDRYPEPLWRSLDSSSGRRESLLTEPAIRRQTPIARYVFGHMQSWRVYHFHDTSETAAVKKLGDVHDNENLRPDASNLAALLYRLSQEATASYEAIRGTIRLVAPFFDDFDFRPRKDNDKLRLEWRELSSDTPFGAHQLSDGTLRFMCLATLLLQPDVPSTVIIDEPELGLHPYAINVLAGLMQSAAERTQLIVSTQSVTLVDQLEPADIIVADRHEGKTELERLDADALAEWLDSYSLGELWQKNVLGGRPVR